MANVKAIQIYLKPGVTEDDLLLAVWRACREKDRPQVVFRHMLRSGLRAMVDSGEMPEAVCSLANLDRLLDRQRPGKDRDGLAGFPPIPHGIPPYAHAYPYPFYVPQAPGQRSEVPRTSPTTDATPQVLRETRMPREETRKPQQETETENGEGDVGKDGSAEGTPRRRIGNLM